MTDPIQQVYCELGNVLANPQSFGLGSQIPEPLEGRLRWMRQMLEHALKKEDDLTADKDLAVELSQDFDHDCL